MAEVAISVRLRYAIKNCTRHFVNDEINLTYQTEKWDVPAKLELNEISIDETSSWLEVKALDKNGVLCLDANNFVEFSVVGDAELIKHQGTSHGSQKVGLCNGGARIKIKKSGEAYSASVKSYGLKTVLLKK